VNLDNHTGQGHSKQSLLLLLIEGVLTVNALADNASVIFSTNSNKLSDKHSAIQPQLERDHQILCKLSFTNRCAAIAKYFKMH